MNRRDFVKLTAAAGAGAMLSARGAAGIPRGRMILPEDPCFRTRHLVVVVLGSGARAMDVVDNRERSPFQSEMIRQGTVFVDDYGETARLHGYMATELLSGRDAPSQRPLFPTWNEYVRKQTGAAAAELWMLQPVSYYGGWTWDAKNYSRHPHYGARYGATSLTANKIFGARGLEARDIVDAHVERRLGHTASERERLVAFLDDVLTSKSCEIPSTRSPVIERQVQVGDCQSILLAGRILKAFKPKIVTVQVLGLDDAHTEFGFREDGDGTGYETYLQHLTTVDELIGRLWADVQADPYFRETTSILIRPECGRDDAVDAYGQLGHTEGNPHAHHVWTTAVGPDFKKGHVVRERVQRRDLAPTIAYLMGGGSAEHATGHVRTQMFADSRGLPRYVLPPTAERRGRMIDWSTPPQERTET